MVMSVGGESFVLYWPSGKVSGGQLYWKALGYWFKSNYCKSPMFTTTSKPETKSQRPAAFWKLSWLNLYTENLSWGFSHMHSRTAMCGYWISSFWNHLLKWVLTINRKFLHSLWVYCRSELDRSSKAETRRDGSQLYWQRAWESYQLTAPGVRSITCSLNE